MALTKAQSDMAINLFSDLFVRDNTVEERKRLFLEFEDIFGKGIHDWQNICRERMKQKLSDKKVIEYFDAFANRKEQKKEQEYQIRKLEKTDLEAVRELINRAFQMCLTFYDDGKFEPFIESGYSFAACNKEELLGVALGYRMPDLSMDAIYIDTLAVAEMARGNGIGRQLLSHISKCAVKNGVYMLKLQTDKVKDAYQFYRHLGFEESELVLMKRYSL